jgi:4'-phosphopantetheinyl transferase EntD
MIERILSAGVAWAESFTDDERDDDLFPLERAHIAAAVNKRRREFATVRMCARKALADLGVPAVAILPGERGAPQWPQAIAGSMTHCDGYRAAAVAWKSDVPVLGIDAEPHGPLPEGVLELISLPQERVHLSDLARIEPGVCWDRLLFSAKESVYKAWFPLTESWLGFEGAEVTLNLDHSFVARLLLPGTRADDTSLAGFDGRWLAENGLLVTAIA